FPHHGFCSFFTIPTNAFVPFTDAAVLLTVIFKARALPTSVVGSSKYPTTAVLLFSALVKNNVDGGDVSKFTPSALRNTFVTTSDVDDPSPWKRTLSPTN